MKKYLGMSSAAVMTCALRVNLTKVKAKVEHSNNLCEIR